MTTIARPYALAAFEFAREKKQLSEWEAMLGAAAIIATDDALIELLSNPKVTTQQLAKLFCDILAIQLDATRKNFILLLAENKRLALLPDITELFKMYRQAQDKTLDAKVISAVELDAAYKQKLMTALTHRFHQKVALHYEIDPDLLGGAIIHAGDTVIDGSIRSKLTRLLESL